MSARIEGYRAELVVRKSLVRHSIGLWCFAVTC